MIVVGVTGNYGMGKSTVSRMFGELGAVTIDADAIVAELLEDPDVVDELRRAIGDDIVRAGAIDKKMLADIIFDSPPLRIAVENILHPRVFREVDDKLAEISQTRSEAVVVIEAPVLYERGYQNRFNKIITVHSSHETAIRNLAKKGIPENVALKRLKSQFPVEMKISRSDYSIDNDNGLDATREQVAHIYKELAALAKGVKHSLSGTLHGNN